ncbi:MAG TPA: sulfatase-like hydrolase/transferase, partial [Acidimicrobiia bacterium]|nr:sulfatase-like hydrolase/transferase [Acidimicrobiia bacterium]
YTQRAVPPALTGRYPPMTAASANWRDHPDNLFRLLGGAYDTHIIESLTVLCPPTVCDGDHDVDVPSEGDGDTAADAPAAADDGLVSVLREARRVYGDLVALDEPDTNAVATLAEEIADVPDDPDGPDSSGEQPTSTTATIAPLPGDDVDPGLGNIEFDPDERTRVQPRRAVEFLDSLHEQPADADPGFWFLHLVLPHNPFHLLPDGGRYAIPGEAEATPGLSGQLEWDDDPWPALAARQRHLLQLRAVDDFVGDVLDELERFDLYDRALVVATADHGASFDAATNFRSISPATASDIAWVPFFVKQPDNVAGGTIDDRNVEIVDLLPTVADVLDIDVPWPVDGRSVFGPARTNATKTFRSAPLFPRDDEDFVELTLDGRAGLRQMLASALVADQAAAGGDVDLAILRTGPYGDLVGQRLDQFDVRSPDARRRAAVDRADAFAAVDLDDELPLFVRGRLDGATGDETVVVALNGTIAGISSVFDDRREPARFTVLIPERLVRSGANELAVYLLDEEEPEGSEGGRGIALTPLELG